MRSLLSKKMLVPLKVQGYYPAFSTVALDAIKRLKHMRDPDGIIPNIRESLIGKWSLESIGKFIYGTRIGLLEEQLTDSSRRFHDAVKNALSKSINFSQVKWMKYIKRSDFKLFEASVLTWYNTGNVYMADVIDHVKRWKDMGEPLDQDIANSLIMYLMFKRNIDPIECQTHAIEQFGGGYDTTSATTTWILHWLGRNQDKQEKLYQEIKEQVPEDGIITDKMVQKMPYLRACIKESARLTPLASANVRSFDQDMVLRGYVIPANTLILISNYGMGRDEKLYPNADSFIPERWLRGNEDATEINPFATLPFGFGARSCLGRRIAEAAMQVFIASLCRQLKVEHIGEEHIGEYVIGLNPSKDIVFAFHDR